MKKLLVISLIFLSLFGLNAQTENGLDRPKIVIGIVVDQMRYDYLTRFYDKYSEDGFKRLLGEGFNCSNAHYNYLPTKTAVGHASIYTGATGSTHGVIANDWYDKYQKRMIYCVDDFEYAAVGTKAAGEQKSPYRMLTTTLTDELRMAQSMKGRTIAIGLKDRSAVLPGGHTSNGSYWFLGQDEGKFITSAFYVESLPDWVEKFNKSGLKDKYMKSKWETLYPISSYTESIEDDNSYERPFEGLDKAVFPYNLKKLKDANANYDLIKGTPYGNTMLVEFAKAAIKGEGLGKNGYTDFLAISFSSPDYIGHQFGVDSKEIQDTYLRLDLDIADFLNYLDQEFGKGEYSLFLTADHAAVQVPAYLKSIKVPAGYFDDMEFDIFVKNYCKKRWGSESLIENISNYQIFLNRKSLAELNLEKDEVARELVELIIDYKGIHKAVSAKTMQSAQFQGGILEMLQNGYNQKLSGDVLWVPDPAVVSSEEQGSQHGSAFTYDTHVPIIFFGKGIAKGVTRERVEIIDIAPTMSSLLQISFPNGSRGRVVEKAFR